MSRKRKFSILVKRSLRQIFGRKNKQIAVEDDVNLIACYHDFGRERGVSLTFPAVPKRNIVSENVVLKEYINTRYKIRIYAETCSCGKLYYCAFWMEG
jgi:hypothetical protein